MNIRPCRLLVLCSVFFAFFCSEVSAAALDATFGKDGRVAVELGIRGSRANAVVAQPDGKIVAAGSSSSTADRDFMLFRLLPDGSLDPEFNLDGTVTTAVGSTDDEALSLALQPDGKIIAAGYSSSEKDRDFALVRYNSDGSLDRSFGTEGMVINSVGNSHDEITDVIVQPDGGIIITGVAQGANGRVVVVGRYLTDGKLDANFADKGFALSVVGVDAQAESVALSKDGHIFVSGSYSDGQRRGLMVLGFDSAGHLEQTFGEKGVAVPTDSSTFSEGYGMFVNADGKILVAGSVGKEGERDAALFGFTAAGHPDSSFEKDGLLVTSAGEGDDALLDVAPAGEMIAAAGFKTTGENREFLLITYNKGTTQENTGGSSLSMQTGVQLKADTLSTGFSSGKDTSTALAVVSQESVVAVGESTTEASSSAAVSKYTLATTNNNTSSGTSKLSPGNQYVLTEEPYEVTRTTAIIPGEILNGLSSVTKRGIVFGTMPNPVLKDSSSSSDSSDSGPVITNNSLSSVSSTSATASATLTLSTDVDATCRYDTTANTAYDQMANPFSITGTKTHSQLVTGLITGTSTYYARCKNTSSGAVNTTDEVISFTVTTAYLSPEHSQQLFAVSVSNALQNAGNFFVGTAIAADSATTNTTTNTTTDITTNNSNTTTTNFLEEGNTSEGSGAGAFSSKLKNLKPGTFFYARAYAISGGVTYYGNQVGFRTADSCFVATAAYGSIFHPSVQILRDFRDQFMRGNAVSRFLIDSYYQHSPVIADLVSQHSSLRFVVRMLLLPVTGAAWLALQLGKAALLLPIALFGFIVLRRKRITPLP